MTVASLRKMDDVVDQVDKLMDDNLKINRVDPYDSDSDASDCDRGRYNKRSDDRRNRRRNVDEERKVLTMHKSGKSKPITSNVRFPQEWPHSHLAYTLLIKIEIMRSLVSLSFVQDMQPF